jgi:hypothetical protein
VVKKRVMVIEDRSSFGPALIAQLRRMDVDAKWLTHSEALHLESLAWRRVDLVLLDAFDIDMQQTDRTRSRLASLDLLDRSLQAACPSDVVVYSTAMRRPEVNIPLRDIGGAAAFFDVNGLAENLATIVDGRYEGQVSPPTPEDWRLLDRRLTPAADVAGAHQKMRTHDRAWRQVWDQYAPFDKAAQVWINRNVLPLLGSPEGGGYAMAVNVVRRISGLPFTLV